ncbi:DHA2 family efflux MFS transporter permease subunit [Methylovirgula sp. HY1]|uniref:DHA2 family efflux MFS transporter permease subunit n=1 Tax=Methylovirgula sp. HY1 TaxID=2822761 RepID=UPI001C5B916D|nr:DHA2 family efflux MFS transporter permease subunit [Methylovirgula sp. HY1]QXX73404.1 Multidrug export protein EmrB [Methylovirgula sp. HY1]
MRKPRSLAEDESAVDATDAIPDVGAATPEATSAGVRAQAAAPIEGGAPPTQSGGEQAPDHRDWRPRSNPWLVAVVVTIAAFMEILDTTIVNVALPHIAGSLSSSSDEATWALTSYLVANGIVLTISGWLGNVLGRKRYFLICIAMFTVCSFLCGTSTSLGELIVFRLLQGFFGGGLQPNQQSIILDYFPPEKRGAAFGVTAVAIIVAPILGPTLGGFITDSSSWRWIFYINVPVGILAVVLVSLLVDDPPWAKARPRGTDFIGLGLITVGLGALQVMLDRGEDENWFGSGFIVMMAMLAAAGLVGAVLWLLVAKKPIVHLAVFKDRNFTAGCIMIASMGGVLYASSVIIPQFAQQVVGYTATWAGMILSPGGIVVLLLIPFVGRLMTFIQTRYIIAAGFFMLGCALLFSRVLVPDIDFTRLVLLRSAQSAALAFLFVPISTITYRTLPRELNGDATALYSMFRNVAGSIGIALSTAAIQQRVQTHEAYLSRWASPFHQPFVELVNRYQAALRSMGHVGVAAHNLALGRVLEVFRTQAAVLAYSDVFFYCSFVAFAMVPFCFLLSATKAGGAGVGAH